MMKTTFCITLLSLLFCGCQSIPDGHDPVYAKGETVVELLSGREGIVEDGYYSHFQRSWRYRVRFVPSSRFTSYHYSSYGSAQAGDATNRGVVWLYGYELLPFKKVSETPPKISQQSAQDSETPVNPIKQKDEK